MVSVLEIAANIATTVSILIAGRNSVHTWWTGILGCLLFAAVFLSAKLYADVVLQLFFIVTSVIGWRQWLHGRSGNPLPITRTTIRFLAWSVLVGLVAAMVYGELLHEFTDAYAPFVDSIILVFSVIAQLLLMRRRIENWMFWLIVNSVAVPLYGSRGLHLTMTLYAAYWINALVSWHHWRRLASENAAVLPVEARG